MGPITAGYSGYSNYYTNPAAVTSAPSNFAPGQLQTPGQTQTAPTNARRPPQPAQQARQALQVQQYQPNGGLKTAAAKNSLNILIP